MTKQEAISKLYDYTEHLERKEYGHPLIGISVENAEKIIKLIDSLEET